MKRDKLTFTVKWLGWDGSLAALEDIEAYDLTEAIGYAARRINKVEHSQGAHGFFVERKREELSS
jgi:hypothetical protein